MAREIAKQVAVKGPKGQAGKCILYADGTIRIDWVRFSYPHLKRPFKGKTDQGEPKFGITALLPKKTHTAAKDLIKGEIERLLTEAKVKALPSDKKFLRDGDKAEPEEYDGMFTVSARESRRPPLRDRNNNVVEPEDAEEIFQPGYWGTVLIRPWFQNNDYGKRVNAGLSSVQMVMKDATFGTGRISDEDLDDTFDKHGDEDGDYDDTSEDDDDDI